MVEAAKAGLDKQRWLDEQMGRGFVHYPMQVGEPERSRRRGYDNGSAGDAAKYEDAHAADDDCGGYSTTTTTCRTPWPLPFSKWWLRSLNRTAP